MKISRLGTTICTFQTVLWIIGLNSHSFLNQSETINLSKRQRLSEKSLSDPLFDPYLGGPLDIPKGLLPIYIQIISQACQMGVSAHVPKLEVKVPNDEEKVTDSSALFRTALSREIDQILRAKVIVEETNPQLIAVTAGTLGIIMALADSRLDPDSIANQLIHNSTDLGIVRGLIHPAMEIMDRAILYGDLEIAQVLAPLISEIHPKIGEILQRRLNLPKRFEVTPATEPLSFLVSMEAYLRETSLRKKNEINENNSFGSHFRKKNSGIITSFRLQIESPASGGNGWLDQTWSQIGLFGNTPPVARRPLFPKGIELVSSNVSSRGPFSDQTREDCISSCESKFIEDSVRATGSALFAGLAAGIKGGIRSGTATGIMSLISGIATAQGTNNECKQKCNETLQESVGQQVSSPELQSNNNDATRGSLPSPLTQTRLEEGERDIEHNRVREVAQKQTREKQELNDRQELQRREMEREHDRQAAKEAESRREAEAIAKEMKENAEETVERRKEEDEYQEQLEVEQKSEREAMERRHQEERERLESQQREERDRDDKEKEQSKESEEKKDHAKADPDQMTIEPDAENPREHRPTTQYLPLPVRINRLYMPIIYPSDPDFFEESSNSYRNQGSEFELNLALRQWMDLICGGGKRKLTSIEINSIFNPR